MTCDHIADLQPVTATVVPLRASTKPRDGTGDGAGLYARAAAARQQSQVLAARLRAAREATAETMQLLTAAWDRAEQVREMSQAALATRLRYSGYARLQARLASMPVIEQAKGVIMAQCGWPEDKAFDALRRASQRENVKLRDLAARVVAEAVRTAQARQPAPAAEASSSPRRSRDSSLGRRSSA